MKKAELFGWLTGLIGLAADLITLFLFFKQRSSGGLSSPSSFHELTIVFSMIYGWFIISWILIRRYWLKTASNRTEELELLLHVDIPGIYQTPNEIFNLRVLYIVSALGILLLPFSMLLPVNYRLSLPSTVQWFFAVLSFNTLGLMGVGCLIYITIKLLMPVIYLDMDELG